MEFKNENSELNYIEEQLSSSPCINVIGKEDFQKRVTKVFHILWEKLSKSFGPGGAGTFISVYPNYYNTKDGFTIMKNIAFDKKLDQVISDMVMQICNRLNFTVGDGTTTATIATKSTYDAYLERKSYFDENFILPRDILSKLEDLKNILLSYIDASSTPIRSDDPKVLRENIEKVVRISSNGNEEITNMIGELYEELMYPAISCTLAKDGVMKSSIIEGYKIDISLTDKIYINNDNNTLSLNGSDVIMFDHKVTKDTYEFILKPLAMDCKQRGRHLVCIAPFYDEMALNGVIQKDLNEEYRKTKDINLVLTVCTKVTGHAKTLLSDLAMLLHTELITSAMESEYISNISNSVPLCDVFDLDSRKIPNINVAAYARTKEANGTRPLVLEVYNNPTIDTLGKSKVDDLLRVGYCDKLSIGLKESIFTGFYYDEEMYQRHLAIAKDELEEITRKVQTIGTFSFELSQKQHRVYALGLKTGLIEVGATSDLSQGYLKDTMDDAIKAAASAYNNGVVLGCNVTLLQCIDKLISAVGLERSIDTELLCILSSGYSNVYKTVLGNIFSNFDFDIINFSDEYDEEMKLIVAKTNAEGISTMVRKKTRYKDFELDPEIFKEIFSIRKEVPDNIYDIIIEYSKYTNTVFDLGAGEFTSDVINSSETDKEILKATIDLLSLLITGNQLVLC